MTTKNEYNFLAKVQEELSLNDKVEFTAVSGYGRIHPIQGVFEDDKGVFYAIGPDSDWKEMNRILHEDLKVSSVELNFFDKKIIIHK